MEQTFDREVTSDFERAESLEWLETNGLGGWASSTVSGAHSRRYHGLLVAATTPPTGRIVLLSRLDETVVTSTSRHELGANRFPGAVHPQGYRLASRFNHGPFPVWEYTAGGARLRKTVAAIEGQNTTVVLYEVVEAAEPFTLELRPFFAGRDYHALTQANDSIAREARFEDGLLAYRAYDGQPTTYISMDEGSWIAEPDWWREFEYARERERGLDFREDLFTPGRLVVHLAAGEHLAVRISTTKSADRDARKLVERERARRLRLAERWEGADPLCGALALAAASFVVRRGRDLRTVIAGYPWFTDWGRDTMIALPGLCLTTGAFDDARRILLAFARAADRGMLPNRFPDRGEEPEYNTADASLWFFVAARAYLEATGDEGFVRDELLPVLRDIVSWHRRGTRHGIREDEDGLLRAGEQGVQLTWMDAKVGDWVVTPRQGKPVEINALWYNALRILAELEGRLGDAGAAPGLERLARRVKHRFIQVFWDPEAGCLADVVDGDARDASIRPNQVFALSLPFPLLAGTRARAVLETIERHLLTPVGLRSLSPGDPRYVPRYEGGVRERDGAYHQGTVWAWLLGPYATALVRVHGEKGRAVARRILRGTSAHLANGCVGSVSEIFDAEPPHAPRGCPAQAWSVSEILRAAVEDARLDAPLDPPRRGRTPRRPATRRSGRAAARPAEKRT